MPEEEEVETVQAPVEKFKCRKCELVFDKTHLASHEQTCLKLGDKESFLKYNEPQVVLRDVRTKTALPSSQEGGAGDEKTASPAPFNKSFANAVRGTSENSDAHVDFSLTRESATNAEKPSGSKEIDQNSVSNKIESKKPEVVKPQKQHKPQNPPTGKKKKLNKNEPAGKKSNDVSQATVPLTTVHEAGENIGLSETDLAIETAYEEVVKWRRNLFDLPKGEIGKKYVDEMSKLLNNWCSTNDNRQLQKLMILPNLLLQRTAKSCKGRVNKEHLQRRFELWDGGKYLELLDECKFIQSRLPPTQGNSNNEETVLKKFRNHIFDGNVNAALRLLCDTGKSGVLGINEQTIEQLHVKHPLGRPLNNQMMLEGPMKYIHPVIFDEINVDRVQKVALRMKGAAGPSNFNSKDWKGVLVSKMYGTSSSDLCKAIVRTAKKLCVEETDNNVAALMACRLIPLDKNPGLRPIGIGEVLRRIIGKLVVSVLRADLQEDAGDLQLCAGQQSGCEAGIHAMHDIYQDENTHGIIQVDANNAFNTINRKMFIHNIKIICPEIAMFVQNCY